MATVNEVAPSRMRRRLAKLSFECIDQSPLFADEERFSSYLLVIRRSPEQSKLSGLRRR
jgi:hypothetical protein